jgi:AraC-like DNA-binding protein
MSESFTTDQIFIRKLTNIIIANLGNLGFGAAEIARESGMSLYRLNRRLHSINGKTTRQFIRGIRLEKALEMLQNETYTVSEVAYRTGFSSPSYFISSFHEYFGYPPGKVQRSGSEEREENLLPGGTPGVQQKRSARRVILYPDNCSSDLRGLYILIGKIYVR